MTRMLTPDVVVPAQCELAEAPVWDPGHGLLRWVDILAGRVHSFDPDTKRHAWFEAGDPVGAVGLTTGQDLILALVDGFGLVDAVHRTDEGHRVRRIGDFATDRAAVRFNDAKPDPWGGCWGGTMPWVDGAGGGALYRLTPDGAVTMVLDNVGLSNGLDWSDDRRTFYFADSDSGGVDAFACDPETGALGARRRLITVPAEEGVPDGLTLDAEGCLWLAVWGASELRRYTPDGTLDTVVRLPVTQVSCPAFAADGTLYITTAWEAFADAERDKQPHAGDIFACRPGVAGRPAFRFATPAG